MKFYRFIPVLLFVFIVSTAKAEIKIGIVDTSIIVEQSTAFMKAKKAIEVEFTKSESNASEIQEKYVKKYENLEKRKNVISAKEYGKEKNRLDKEAQVEQKALYNQRLALNKEFSNINQALEISLTGIIKDLAETKEMSIVLNKAVALYSSDLVDITDEVISKANSELKSIAMNLPTQ